MVVGKAGENPLIYEVYRRKNSLTWKRSFKVPRPEAMVADFSPGRSTRKRRLGWEPASPKTRQRSDRREKSGLMRGVHKGVESRESPKTVFNFVPGPPRTEQMAYGTRVKLPGPRRSSRSIENWR